MDFIRSIVSNCPADINLNHVLEILQSFEEQFIDTSDKNLDLSLIKVFTSGSLSNNCCYKEVLLRLTFEYEIPSYILQVAENTDLFRRDLSNKLIEDIKGLLTQALIKINEDEHLKINEDEHPIFYNKVIVNESIILDFYMPLGYYTPI